VHSVETHGLPSLNTKGFSIECPAKFKVTSAEELILTGSHKPFPKLFKEADLVTEIKKQKHPYDNGVQARKGIEY